MRALGLLLALAIGGGNPPTAGARGTVTAWDVARAHVLEHRFCVKVGGGWDYVTCAREVRERVGRSLCREQGPGDHDYLLQLGDDAPAPASTRCSP